jgi:hypothetical protein
MLFDCEADLKNWKQGWAPEKREWCCQQRARGCLEPPEAVADEDTTSKPLFDCAAGLANWEAGWSPEKKAWCCDGQGAGCEEATTS